MNSHFTKTDMMRAVAKTLGRPIVELPLPNPFAADPDHPARLKALDAAYAATYALGGTVDPKSEDDIEHDKAVTEILQFIADLGGMLPADRKHWRG